MGSRTEDSQVITEKEIAKFGSLERAAYVLRQLVEGKSDKDIEIAFGKEDGQMVKMMKLFLLGNHYIEHQNGNYVSTELGEKFVRLHESQI